MPSPSELRQQITNQIVAALEQGLKPFWRRPWRTSPNAGRPTSIATHRPYQGINTLLLDLHAERFGFASKYWATFQQWESRGCKVKRRPAGVDPGAWGCRVVFYKPTHTTITDEGSGEEEERQFFLMKSFTVFNAEQVDGDAAAKFLVAEDHHGEGKWSHEPADELIAATNATIHHGGEKAYYLRPTPDDSFPNHQDGDYICVPNKERFDNLGAYYETIFHELAHWSELRLGWDHRTETYAMGELVAELASYMLVREVGVPPGEDLSNHATYIASWLQAMKNDTRFIFKASTQASKVSDFLLGFVRKEQTVEAT